MAANSSKQPIVLNYKKRRFDGGPEIDVIAKIEHERFTRLKQQEIEAQSQHIAEHASPLAETQEAEAPASVVESEATLPRTRLSLEKISQSLHKAFVTPYTELVLGLIGIAVATLLIQKVAQQAYANPESLEKERKALIEQSSHVIRNSVKGIFLAPWTALRLCAQ